MDSYDETLQKIEAEWKSIDAQAKVLAHRLELLYAVREALKQLIGNNAQSETERVLAAIPASDGVTA
jgi:hypothetical protein